jgi:hypothetical protein
MVDGWGDSDSQVHLSLKPSPGVVHLPVYEECVWQVGVVCNSKTVWISILITSEHTYLYNWPGIGASKQKDEAGGIALVRKPRSPGNTQSSRQAPPSWCRDLCGSVSIPLPSQGILAGMSTRLQGKTCTEAGSLDPDRNGPPGPHPIRTVSGHLRETLWSDGWF